MKTRLTRSALTVIAGALISVLAPADPMTPSAWAADNLVVPDGPNAGDLWDVSLTPYVVEPLDGFSDDSPVNEIDVRKSAQSGFTTLILAATGHMIDSEPCRMMIVQPTSGAMQDFNRDKLSPAIEKSKALKRKVKPQTSRAGDASTTTSKIYPGGSLTLAIASSPADLRSKTVKKVALDEVDEYPDDLDQRGDPVGMIEARQESFLMSGDWKRLQISTPTIKGASRIDARFHGGDQRYWFMPCPGCGEPFRFEFDRSKFKFEEVYPFKSHYELHCCGTVIEDAEKVSVMLRGEWKPTAECAPNRRSYHFDALTSPFVPWATIAQRFVEAKDDPTKLKTFYNLTLGLPYDMASDVPDHERLMERRSKDFRRGTIPPAGLVTVGAADVQMRGIWYLIKAYSHDRQTYRVDAGYIEGATDDPHGGAFVDLERIRTRARPDSFGRSRTVDSFAVDSGYRSHIVYTWARGKTHTFAVKGDDGWSKPAIGQPTPQDIDFNGKRTRRGIMLWPVGTWSLKGAFYANLRKLGVSAGKEFDPPGYCHFGDWLDEEYFKQITGEYLTTETFRGRSRAVWKPRAGHENHLLDCEVYCDAIADYLGVNRMTQQEWASLAAMRGVPLELSDGDVFAPDPVKASRAAAAQPSQNRARDDETDSWWSR